MTVGSRRTVDPKTGRHGRHRFISNVHDRMANFEFLKKRTWFKSSLGISLALIGNELSAIRAADATELTERLTLAVVISFDLHRMTIEEFDGGDRIGTGLNGLHAASAQMIVNGLNQRNEINHWKLELSADGHGSPRRSQVWLNSIHFANGGRLMAILTFLENELC